MKRYLFGTIRSLERSFVGVIALPALPAVRLGIHLNRRVLVVVLLGLGIMALITYVAAVNSIILGGETIKRHQRELSTLEREAGTLEEELSQLQSPAWLASQSSAYGMVSVGSIRYLRTDDALARSR